MPGYASCARPGRMHPRIRAIAASFLCFDLGVDWRVGRDEWDRFLIEDAPALATGNWQWIAGVGADLAAYPRIYNPVKQAHRFDPGAGYVRRWIPELAGLPDAAIFERARRPAAARAPALRRAPLPAADASITRTPRARSSPATGRSRAPGSNRLSTRRVRRAAAVDQLRDERHAHVFAVPDFERVDDARDDRHRDDERQQRPGRDPDDRDRGDRREQPVAARTSRR